MLQHRFSKLKHEKYVERFVKYYDTKGTNHKKYVEIAEYVSDKFVSVRFDGLNHHLYMWALEKATIADIPIFEASPSWVYGQTAVQNILPMNYKISVLEIPYQ